MRTLGQLLICVLLAVPSAQAAFGPWDLEADNAAALALKLEHHVAQQSGKLAIYLQVPAAQLRAVADLPLMRELTRTIGLDALLRHHAPPLSVRACRQRA
jgi:hypothetical protein